MEMLVLIILLILIVFFHELGHYLFFISEVGIVPTIYMKKLIIIGVGNEKETLQSTANQLRRIYIAGIIGGFIPLVFAVLNYISYYEFILFSVGYFFMCAIDILGIFQLHTLPKKYHNIQLKYFKTFLVDDRNNPTEMIDECQQ